MEIQILKKERKIMKNVKFNHTMPEILFLSAVFNKWN